ncbi:UNVERIFIED_CONTAM: Pentatricopeptide repeat-containing protein [Sesamum latifolium]|uniref:Pentatricopeptide repeat-containing protein n=1 Tax=Sesamum latifolium TaxID=2727402 RepID=A0AAW2TBJ6_9LAMI
MEIRRLVPSEITFVGVLYACSHCGLVDEGFAYFDRMTKEFGVVPTIEHYGCMVDLLGEVARDKLKMLEPKHCGDYVLLSNLYASERRWSDVHNVRRTMLKEGVKKVPGFSLVELGNRIHEFVMGDMSHPQTEAIYAMLSEMTRLLKLEGYAPHTTNVLADIEEEEKETALSYHSEKIAIAFVLINTPRGPQLGF